jgi:transposase
MRTTELGVTITDAAVDEKQTTIFCTPVARDPRCPDCGRQGRYRDTVTRPLTDLRIAGYPLVLRVAVPRYRCDTVDYGRAVFNQDLGKLACPRSSTTRRCARYVLRRLMIDRTTISAIAVGHLDESGPKGSSRSSSISRPPTIRLVRISAPSTSNTSAEPLESSPS